MADDRASRSWPWTPAQDSTALGKQDADLPKISVVTPSFNQAKFLEATIRSVLLQNYPNLEYVVIDGGSHDGSVEIIERYQQHFSYWHSRTDAGQADAIAVGFDKTDGEIMCWLNSDDLLLPNTLLRIGRKFASNRRVDFLYGNRLVIDEAGACIGRHAWPHILTRYHWAMGQPMAQECCFWRRSLFNHVGGLDKSKFFILDYDLFVRMWRVGKFKKLPATLGCYRVHEESKNALHQEVRTREMSEALKKYGLTPPGRIVRRLLSHFDAAQLAFERADN